MMMIRILLSCDIVVDLGGPSLVKYRIELKKAFTIFLGPRGPLVLPSVGPVPSRPSRAKNLDHLYTGIYAL